MIGPEGGTDWLGTGAVLALVFLIAALVGRSRLPAPVKLLVYAGLALRVVGSVVRYLVNFEYYGTGDALEYHRWGLRYAEYFARLDFSPITNPDLWWRDTGYGTQFMLYPAGLLATVLGPTLYGQFVIFSLLSFLGLVGFVIAFRRSYPEVPIVRYARWVWLLPSLWYWPSSLGKDALILLGVGLVVWGFVGSGERINWALMGAGMLIVFSVRPQVLMVLLFALAIGHWLSFRQLNAFRVVQGVIVLAVALGGTWISMRYLGIESFDVEGVQSYMADGASRRITKGSSVEAAPVGLAGIPMALANVLVRPFPFEARNPMVLFASLEITAFWVIAFLRRRQLLESLRHWRSDRLLRFSIPFILLYAASLGMMLSNLGIIARQRVVLFPFLFLLLEAVPKAARRRAPAAAGGAPSGEPAPLPPLPPLPGAGRAPLPAAAAAAGRPSLQRAL